MTGTHTIIIEDIQCIHEDEEERKRIGMRRTMWRIRMRKEIGRRIRRITCS